jgi:hypothetical protein
LDPSFSVSFSERDHSAMLAFEQDSSHGTPDRSYVPQADPHAAPYCITRTGGKTGKKTGPMSDKHAKVDIKLKENSMNITTYRAR